MVISDEIIYSAIVALYATQIALQKRDTHRLEREAKECRDDRKELRENQIRHFRKTAQLEKRVIVLSTKCPQGDCPREKLVDDTTAIILNQPAGGKPHEL